MVPPLPLEIAQQIIAATSTLDNLTRRPALLPSLALVHRNWTPFAQLLMRTSIQLDELNPTLLKRLSAPPFATQLTSLRVVAISPFDLGALLFHTPNLVQLDAAYKRDDDKYLRSYKDGLPLPSPESLAPFLGKDLSHLRTLLLDASELGGELDPGRHFPTLAKSLAPFSTLRHLSVTEFNGFLESELGPSNDGPPPPPATFALQSLKLDHCWTFPLGPYFDLSAPTLAHLALRQVEPEPLEPFRLPLPLLTSLDLWTSPEPFRAFLLHHKELPSLTHLNVPASDECLRAVSDEEEAVFDPLPLRIVSIDQSHDDEHGELTPWGLHDFLCHGETRSPWKPPRPVSRRVLLPMWQWYGWQGEGDADDWLERLDSLQFPEFQRMSEPELHKHLPGNSPHWRSVEELLELKRSW